MTKIFGNQKVKVEIGQTDRSKGRLGTTECREPKETLSYSVLTSDLRGPLVAWDQLYLMSASRISVEMVVTTCSGSASLRQKRQAHWCFSLGARAGLCFLLRVLNLLLLALACRGQRKAQPEFHPTAPIWLFLAASSPPRSFVPFALRRDASWLYYFAIKVIPKWVKMKKT